MANRLIYGGGLKIAPPPPPQPLPFHPSQMINMNGMVVYPSNFINQPVYPSQRFLGQQTIVS